MSSEEPLVSVIISLYNEEDVLEESLESILSQSYPNLEVLCIDDGSSDNTPEIVRRYASETNSVELIENSKNLGLTKSLNKGIEQAEGKYIARQDADDLSKPQRISEQVRLMEENPDTVLCGQYDESVEWIDEEGEEITSFEKIGAPEPEKLEKENQLIHSSIMFRNNGLKYRDKFQYAQDYDLYLRLLSNKNSIMISSRDWVSRCLRKDSVGMQNRPKQNYCASKAKEYYKQRKKTGKDCYSEEKFNLPKKAQRESSSKYSYHRNRMRKALESGNLEYAREAYLDYINCPETKEKDKLKYYPIIKLELAYRIVKKLGIRGI